MIVIQVRYFLVVHGLIETPLKVFFAVLLFSCYMELQYYQGKCLEYQSGNQKP